jgi:hypothetical protein
VKNDSCEGQAAEQEELKWEGPTELWSERDLDRIQTLRREQEKQKWRKEVD